MLSCIHYRSHGNAATFKPEIFRYWQRPNLLPEDLFDLTFGGTDYAWVIMGDPFTGTLPHLDPDMTAAWNLLVHGRKVILTLIFSDIALKQSSVKQIYSHPIFYNFISSLIHINSIGCCGQQRLMVRPMNQLRNAQMILEPMTHLPGTHMSCQN